jgi:predicted nucleic acid-binding protein
MPLVQPLLVDSNIYIRLLRKQRDPVAALFVHYDPADLVTCGMVRLEVLRGVRDERLRERLGNFMATMRCVASDDTLWHEATRLAWRLDRRGFVIPAADALIAASALRVGAAVLTTDRDFDRVEELSVLAPPPTLA